MTESLPITRRRHVLDADRGCLMLWLGSGQLTAIVSGLPHAVAGCTDEVTLPQVTLRSPGGTPPADTTAPAGPAAPRARRMRPPH